MVAGCLLSLGIGYVSFQRFLLFPAAQLQLALLSGFFMVLGSRLTREEREKAPIRNMFEGYVSDDVVNLLSGLIELKDFKRAKSVLAELDGKAGYKPVVDYFSPMVNAGGK